jgi:hypothetical protein
MGADPVVARYRQAGSDCAQSFGSLSEAYDFLRRGADVGGVAMTDIESIGGVVIVSRQAFEELRQLDAAQCEGWLAVLARTSTADDRCSPLAGLLDADRERREPAAKSRNLRS